MRRCVFLLAALGAGGLAAQEKRYVVIVDRVTVSDMRDGKPYVWDFAFTAKGQLPDPFVVVQRREEALEKQCDDLDRQYDDREAAFIKRYEKTRDPDAWAAAFERDPLTRAIDAKRTGLRAKFVRETPHRDDTLEAVYNFDTVTAKLGDRVLIRVMDKDLEFHDLMGETEIVLDQKAVAGLDLKFGDVVSLKLKFKRAP